MKLIINKFPPLTQRCEIDLSKKLTLFVGENNSGKTYISQLIWGIFKEEYIKSKEIESINFINSIQIGQSIINIDINFLNQISKKFTNFLIKIRIQKIFKQNIECDFNIIINEAEFKSIEFQENNDEVFISKNKHSSKINIDITKENRSSVDFINHLVLYIIISYLRKTSLFLPSSRLFLPSFYKHILNTEKNFKDSMYNNLDKINEDNKKFYAPSYTEPVDNLIKKLIFSLDSPLEHNVYLDKLSEIIEGKISVDRAEEIGMADISYNHKSGENIPMYLSSSMVNQLSTLYLYFKHWHKDNSFLIIDEPEMNLHPKKKIEVMELLMHFASENKLLMATHSNTIAKSIINYMHLFDLKEKNGDSKTFIEENGLKMDNDIALSSNDIGIYYFNGNTIIPYKKDNNSDIHFGTFSEVEELQNKQFEYIIDELENYES